MNLKNLLRNQTIGKIHSNPTLRQNYIQKCLVALIFLCDLNDYGWMMIVVIVTVS